MHEEEDSEYKILFDPKAFVQEQGELKIEDYKLDTEELKEFAIEASNLRSKIMEKAYGIKLAESDCDDKVAN